MSRSGQFPILVAVVAAWCALLLGASAALVWLGHHDLNAMSTTTRSLFETGVWLGCLGVAGGASGLLIWAVATMQER